MVMDRNAAAPTADTPDEPEPDGYAELLTLYAGDAGPDTQDEEKPSPVEPPPPAADAQTAGPQSEGTLPAQPAADAQTDGPPATARPAWWDTLTEADADALREHPVFEKLRPKAFESNADRILTLLSQGRGNELSPTELFKAGQLARTMAQAAPDVGQPLVDAGYQAGRQQAEEENRRRAAYDFLTREVQAARAGDDEAGSRIRQQFPQFQNWDDVEEYRQAYRMSQKAQAERVATQQQQASITEPIRQQTAIEFSDANLTMLRRLPAFAQMSDADWDALLAEGRQSGASSELGAYWGMVSHAMQAGIRRSAAPDPQPSAPAQQAAAQRAAQQRLNQMPDPESSGGLETPGGAPDDYAAAADLFSRGRMTYTQFMAVRRKHGIDF